MQGTRRADREGPTSAHRCLVLVGNMGGRAKAHAGFDLQDGLREVFGTDADPVMVAAVRNRYLARAVKLTKWSLYAA